MDGTLDVVNPPRRFLFLTGALLVATGLVHLGVFLVDGGPWGGPVSWRKPATFGISFGVTALAVAWIAGFLGLSRRTGWLLLGGLGGASALEVAWVALQAWCGVPSHFAGEGVDGARGRTGGQKPKLTARQATIAQDMYDEKGEDGRRRYTVAEIAAEFGVTRPTIYRHLQAQSASGAPARLAP